MLQRILRARLTFTPRADGLGYDFSGPTRFDKLFTGMTLEPAPDYIPKSRRGFEDMSPEDTFDGDYGRLLERAHQKREKVVASPDGSAHFDGEKGEKVVASPKGSADLFRLVGSALRAA